MSLIFNGTQITDVIYNGANLTELIYNGVTVWQKVSGTAFEMVGYRANAIIANPYDVKASYVAELKEQDGTVIHSISGELAPKATSTVCLDSSVDSFGDYLYYRLRVTFTPAGSTQKSYVDGDMIVRPDVNGINVEWLESDDVYTFTCYNNNPLNVAVYIDICDEDNVVMGSGAIDSLIESGNGSGSTNITVDSSPEPAYYRIHCKYNGTGGISDTLTVSMT